MTISLTRLRSFYAEFRPSLLLHAIVRREFPGSVALVATHDAASLQMLSLAADIDATLPVAVLTPPHKKENATVPCVIETLGFSRVDVLPLESGIAAAGNNWKERLSEWLESLGSLAFVTGRQGPKFPRIDLDENGVFRINPLAGILKEAQKQTMHHPDFDDSDALPEYCANALWPCVEQSDGIDAAQWSV